MTKKFKDQIVVVTGANSGIGETIAASFEEAGATVFAIARSKPSIDAARTKHPRVHWVLADVSNATQIRQAIDGIVKETGTIDVLVNNAAVFFFGPLEQATEAQLRNQLEINVLGTTFSTQAALASLKASKGSIINISSAAGHKAAAGASHYAATKAAVESLTRSWALELAPAGVRVNAIAPGPTETPVFDKLGLPPEVTQNVKEAFVKQVPLGRMASTAEIARWVVSLADPEVTWVTGQIISIDGGKSLT